MTPSAWQWGEISKGWVWGCQPCFKTSTLRFHWALDTHKPRGDTSSTDRFSVPGESRSRVLLSWLSWNHASTTLVTNRAFPRLQLTQSSRWGPVGQPGHQNSAISGRKTETLKGKPTLVSSRMRLGSSSSACSQASGTFCRTAGTLAPRSPLPTGSHLHQAKGNKHRIRAPAGQSFLKQHLQ